MCKGLEWEMLEQFRNQLTDEERSSATIEKYMRDVEKFFEYAAEAEKLDKELAVVYKQSLLEKGAVTSANSRIAALNRFSGSSAGVTVS